MRISTFGRHVREGGKNVIRNGWMTFASMSAISISLFILGLFLLLALNVNYLAQQVENQVEIRVFLDVETTQETIGTLQNGISALPGVKSVKFVSKADGLQMLRGQMGDGAKDYLEGLDGADNPLNDSFTVEVIDPQNVADAAKQIEALNDTLATKPIIKVKYGQGTVETMFKVTKIVRYVGLAMVGCLVLTAMFLISNTIKLTILARNREIRIMKLVGATNSFIRWPFFIEGGLLGLIGSLIPTLILEYGYWEFMQSGFVRTNTFMKFKQFADISPQLGMLLLGIGVVIGIWGSTISVRKYLRV